MSNILVVSCMDLRMVPLVYSMMENKGYKGRYDLVSVFGMSLSAKVLETDYYESCQTF